MANYIDGFVFPISTKHLGDYKRLAEKVAEIWQEHGALDYREYVGDDMNLLGTRSFTEVVAANQTDVIIFGWVTFASRAARDLANSKVAVDPRMADFVELYGSGFDATKMAYGGFKPLIQPPNTND